MNIKSAIFLLLIWIFILPIHAQEETRENIDEKLTLIAMRMIGHEVLLSFGDSTSRVLPIEKEDGRYKISFATKFMFNPDDMITTVDQAMKKAEISNRYLVEVANCETETVIYSYRMGNSAANSIIPCRERGQPEACYHIFITLLPPVKTVEPEPFNDAGFSLGIPVIIGLLSISFLAFAGFIYFRRRNGEQSSEQSHYISVGEYQFDPRNLELIRGNEKTELTGKEAELLLLLYDSANTTLDRETILKNVWGDEGDYIGRTLDVFISKLRKKLAADSNVKILNIRGVGYRFVVN